MDASRPSGEPCDLCQWQNLWLSAQQEGSNRVQAVVLLIVKLHDTSTDDLDMKPAGITVLNVDVIDHRYDEPCIVIEHLRLNSCKCRPSIHDEVCAMVCTRYHVHDCATGNVNNDTGEACACAYTTCAGSHVHMEEISTHGAIEWAGWGWGGGTRGIS